MKGLRIIPEWKSNLRPGGGLYVGVRITFPSVMHVERRSGQFWVGFLDNNDLRSVSYVSIGLLAWQLLFTISWPYAKKS
jgi:hypothetical protein